ncbi:MAG: ABC transporter ATP-binding protein/permease, partial [Hydrogenophaga sp.]|uniref:ABCB family ABC transporter ATP-binding protein/permease n=1 Tax=Hydrogenophaga sp. TaxID=1904254 RepID=UPI0026192A7F
MRPDTSARTSIALPSGPGATGTPPARRSDWGTLRRLLPYLWQYKVRVVLALAFMVAAKTANVGVPLLLKELVDAMTIRPGSVESMLVVPLGLLLAYGLLRLSTSVFTELRELVFAKATEGATRSIALQVFGHLHALSLRFHLDRQTGGMTRDIERGTRGVQSLISYSLYSIFPTLIEVIMVLALLGTKFDMGYVWITLVALVMYVTFTVLVTEWRTQFRRQMNEADGNASTRAIDSLLNYETVKYFGNEAHEARRFDSALKRYERAAVLTRTSLSVLNLGQAVIIAVGVTLVMFMAANRVVDGTMTVGDFVLANTYLMQLYQPLNMFGFVYREIKQALIDIEQMFVLLAVPREVEDAPDAPDLALDGGAVRFEEVHFGYDARRPILKGVSFAIPAGHKVAVVGASGAGKSTLARLLYRFYDVDGGAVTIDGQDLRAVSQASLRRAIGIVPQDTVLFNDTIAYNIAYGRTAASPAEIEQAARLARIHDFVMALPDGYQTIVGERGLKLSGGEK